MQPYGVSIPLHTEGFCWKLPRLRSFQNPTCQGLEQMPMHVPIGNLGQQVLEAECSLEVVPSWFVVQKRIEKEHPIKMIKIWIGYFQSFLGFYNHGWPLNPPLLQTFVEIEVNAAAEPAAAATLAADQPEDESATSPESWDFDLTPKRFRAPYICRSSKDILGISHYQVTINSWVFYLGDID